jgi:cytochrome c
MSGIEINKFAGAILTAALLAMMVGMLGDALVHPGKHVSSDIQIAAQQPAAEPEKKKELPPIAPLLAKADASAGAREANKCKACHDLTNAKKARIGPPLWNVVQSDKGKMEGFSYSPAMKGAEGKWSYEDLNHFLADPKGMVKGTKMVFAGIKDDHARANVIAYLRSLSDSPKPMP